MKIKESNFLIMRMIQIHQAQILLTSLEIKENVTVSNLQFEDHDFIEKTNSN